MDEVGQCGYYIENKTQYDWFPGKSQNSKKFIAKFKQGFVDFVTLPALPHLVVGPIGGATWVIY